MTDRELMQEALDALFNLRWAASERDKKNRIRQFDEFMDGSDEAIEALRARLAQPEQEPVAWWHDMGDVVDLNVSGRGIPLYTAPPQREWQGLTDEEANELTYASIAEIEAKLKEKNGF